MFLEQFLGAGLKKPAKVGSKPSISTLPADDKGKGNSDLASLREQITRRVAGRALKVVDCALDAAEGGQLVAMKYLFEGVGLFPAPPDNSGQAEGQDVLARTLLDHLGLLNRPRLETQGEKDSELAPPGAQHRGDALE